MTKVVVELPNHWAVGGESMWATPVGPDLYRLENVPFYAYDLNYHDVVRAVAPSADGKPLVVTVVRRSGHLTLRVLFPDELQPAVLEALEKLGVDVERANDKYVALDVPPETDYEAVRDQLDEWVEQHVLDYETCEARVEGSFDDAPEAADA